MPNKILFIESNTTGTGILALKKVVSWGLEALFFTNSPERYLDLNTTGCRVIVCDTNHLSCLRETIEQQVKPEEICGIVTTSDFYLEIVAELTSLFDLPGNPVEAIRTARHKGLTRQTLSASGIHQPRYEMIRSLQDVKAAVDKIGLPCVVKPADDSASNNVLLVHTWEQAQQHAKKILSVDYNIRGQRKADVVLIEEYVDAPEFSVEMFTWQGNTTCIGITQKSLIGFPYFVESRHLFPAFLPADVAEQIEATVRHALKAIGIQNGATHTELKWTSGGASIIEINARLAGGMIPELIRLATDIDILEQHILSAVGRPTIGEVRINGVAGIQFLVSEQEGILEGIEGMEAAAKLPFVKQLTITAKPGAEVQSPQNAYHRLGHVVVHSPSFAETVTCLQQAMDRMHIHIVKNGVGGRLV
ncbi:ATP-grasp domain-containing protein [Paenibacillus sp. SC116]|uniref:ATP-grasp domain-containing protein n=1 Tax=Paenibacillus sp. SC116 TaxID=2968986 RepID=UPI00215A5794|nr:ATP-grasp domain-containing protein [Paenibacillus sp. SC116]MCR8844958.1 ATP-grasp domain-containing protein [Paenibacillus sp. SC116]